MAKRRRMSSRRAAAHEFTTQLAKAAGVEHDQLELGLAAPRFVPDQSCGECHRRGYHLAGCSVGRIAGGS